MQRPSFPPLSSRLTQALMGLSTALGTLATYPVEPALGLGLDHLELGASRGSFTESYLEQETESRLLSHDRILLRWDAEFSTSDRFRLRLSRSAYQLDDRDFPGTLHRRQETGLDFGALRTIAVPAGGLLLGLGYSLDVMQVENSAKLPGDDPGFLFVPWQAFHGPALMADYQVELLGPVGFRLGTEWLPFVFANLADGRLPMPAYMTTFRLDPRVTLWGDRFALGYVYQRTVGAGYDRGTSGVFASFSLVGI